MKWYSTYSSPKGARFVIRKDTRAGYYLYVYEDYGLFDEDRKATGTCSRHQQDHLQDTLEIAQDQALEDFGVPLDSWMQVERPE